ncbi:hypothetical protein HRbin36_00431 [bacterium HR36]|uniref:Uncharacterized protein n=1 Tax=uncultured Planctomycetota bacterium TaxID=120965 RepID=H5SCQ4_9BACT|nr:hypothetical protein HGMM_F11F07C12 [uncultured Planctomycetota bacterium]GBD35320.1 hypothetical protein HRbin36_00431 [bacterium HR36]
MSEPIHLPPLTRYSGHSASSEHGQHPSRRRTPVSVSSPPSPPVDEDTPDIHASAAEKSDHPGKVVDIQA